MEGDFTFAGSPSAVGPLTLTNLESMYAEYAEVESPLVSVSMFDHATTTSDHIWTLTDLQVLHELRIPVTVVVPSIAESTHRYTSVGARKTWSVHYKRSTVTAACLQSSRTAAHGAVRLPECRVSQEVWTATSTTHIF